MTDNRQESSELFSQCVDNFDEWALSNEDSEFRSALGCASVLSELNFRALKLPGPIPQKLSEIELPELNPSEIDTAKMAALRLPLRHYLKIFNPSDPKDTKPVTGDLVDDIVDIYQAIVPPNRLFKNGDIDDAIWHWNLNYKTHIGWHVTSAIYTLNAYLMHQAKQYVE